MSLDKLAVCMMKAPSLNHLTKVVALCDELLLEYFELSPFKNFFLFGLDLVVLGEQLWNDVDRLLDSLDVSSLIGDSFFKFANSDSLVLSVKQVLEKLFFFEGFFLHWEELLIKFINEAIFIDIRITCEVHKIMLGISAFWSSEVGKFSDALRH